MQFGCGAWHVATHACLGAQVSSSSADAALSAAPELGLPLSSAELRAEGVAKTVECVAFDFKSAAHLDNDAVPCAVHACMEELIESAIHLHDQRLQKHRVAASACARALTHAWAQEWPPNRDAMKPLQDALYDVEDAWEDEFPNDKCDSCNVHMTGCTCLTTCPGCDRQIYARSWICKHHGGGYSSRGCLCEVHAAHGGKVPWCWWCKDHKYPRPRCPVGCKLNIARIMFEDIFRGVLV